MEELLSISSYKDDEGQTWFRVKLQLIDDCLMFDVHGITYIDKVTLLKIMKVCRCVVSYDQNHFDSLINPDALYFGRESDLYVIEKFCKDNVLKDFDGNNIDTLLIYEELQ